MISLTNLILTAIVYMAAIVCIPIMKKIEPDNNWYPVYAIVVLMLFTAFLVTYLSIECRQFII